MKLFSTKTHGMLDYLTAGTLLALPSLIKPSSGVRSMLQVAALGTAAYSLLTNYELGVKGLLPMKTHLLLDGMSGALFAASPLLFANERGDVKAILAGIGAFELAASLMTEEQPRGTPESRQVTQFA